MARAHRSAGFRASPSEGRRCPSSVVPAAFGKFDQTLTRGRSLATELFDCFARAEVAERRPARRVRRYMGAKFTVPCVQLFPAPLPYGARLCDPLDGVS